MSTQPPTRRDGAALVTGASSGIGHELASLFAHYGYPVVLVARDRQRLEALAQELGRRYGVAATVVPKDLALASAPQELFDELSRASIPVAVLVNNAGFGTYGEFAGADAVEQLRMIQVNVTALTHLTRLFLPGMVQRRSGRVLNVASTAAFQPGPLMAVYYATKAYVLSFSEALANELRGSGVTVTALCPGPTTTQFQRRAGVEQTRLMSGRIMDARSVALAGFQGVLAGRPVVIPGARNRLLTFGVRLLPRSVVTAFVRNIQEARRVS